jgi:hypothetical protein
VRKETLLIKQTFHGGGVPPAVAAALRESLGKLEGMRKGKAKGIMAFRVALVIQIPVSSD